MRRGFTLIEMLAVVVILALVASTLAVGLANSAHASEWQGAVAEIGRFDRLARLTARTEGALDVAVDSGTLVASRHSTVLLRSSAVVAPDASGASSHADASPALQLDRSSGHGGGHENVTAIAIDSRGRSIDFSYRLTDGKRVLRVHVAGLTGFTWTEEEE